MINAKEAYQKTMSYRNKEDVMKRIEETILSAVKLGWTSVRVPISPSLDMETRDLIFSELESLGYHVSCCTTMAVHILSISWV